MSGRAGVPSFGPALLRRAAYGSGTNATFAKTPRRAYYRTAVNRVVPLV